MCLFCIAYEIIIETNVIAINITVYTVDILNVSLSMYSGK